MKSNFPRDPSTPFAAADTFGWLVAADLMQRDEALAAMWEAADKLVAPDLNRMGLRTRIAWALTDATRWAERTRSRTARDICKRLAPLLAHRAPWDALIRAAREVNEAGEHVGNQPMLLPHELHELVAEEAAWWLRRSKRHAA